MQVKIVWQQNSSDPENANNLAFIKQWWMSLNGREVAWRQRLLSAEQELDAINWEPQKFDEVFQISTPQIRGITLYWVKPGANQERNTTPDKLVLDNLHQQLYVYPKSQSGVVYRVGLPEIKYQTLELNHPEIEAIATSDKYILTLKDSQQKIMVKSILSIKEIEKLQEQLSGGS
jgi:hypothetical protein